MLECQGISKTFGEVTALKRVDLRLDAGQIVGLIGPNGSGKSTLVNVISGFYQPDEGNVLLDGKRMTGRHPHQLRAAGISRTFQNLRLFEELTALDNLMIGLHLAFTEGGSWHPTTIARAVGRVIGREFESDARLRAEEMLERFGMSQYSTSKVKNLSYGLRKRLEMARALAVMPKVLLLDEPTAGLTAEDAADLLDLFRRPVKDLAVAVLLIEHRLEWVLEVSDRVAVLDAGEKIADDAPATIASHANVIKAYIGE